MHHPGRLTHPPAGRGYHGTMAPRTLLLPFAVAAVLAVPSLGSEPCGSCHEAHREQWEASFHARSLTDPLYLGMRDWASSEAGEGILKLCRTCHSVPVLGTGKRTPGVTCEACHQGVAVGEGPAGWHVDPNAPVAAPTGVEAPHGIVRSAALVTGEVCMACHAELSNPRGVPLCTTGPESETTGPAPGCLQCHMRGGSHTFEGTSPALLRSAADLWVDFRGEEAEVVVINRGAGHALPTGSALRQVVLEAAFLDASGKTLTSTTRVFSRVFEDAEGNAPVPPWRAAAVRKDTRLRRGERRVLTLPVPVHARMLTVRLVYRRAPPPVLRRLGLVDHPLAEPVEMARLVREVPGR